jgi:hypothetical protein
LSKLLLDDLDKITGCLTAVCKGMMPNEKRWRMNVNTTLDAESSRRAQEFFQNAFGDMAPAGAMPNLDGADLFNLTMSFGLQELASQVGNPLPVQPRLRSEKLASSAGQGEAPGSGQAAGGTLINVHGAQGARRVLRVRENVSYLRLMVVGGAVSGVVGGVGGGLSAMAVAACLGAGGGWFLPGAVVGGVLGGAYGCAVSNARYLKQTEITNNLKAVCALRDLLDEVPQKPTELRDHVIKLQAATLGSTAIDRRAFKEALQVLRTLANPAVRSKLAARGIELL